MLKKASEYSDDFYPDDIEINQPQDSRVESRTGKSISGQTSESQLDLEQLRRGESYNGGGQSQNYLYDDLESGRDYPMSKRSEPEAEFNINNVRPKLLPENEQELTYENRDYLEASVYSKETRSSKK